MSCQIMVAARKVELRHEQFIWLWRNQCLRGLRESLIDSVIPSRADDEGPHIYDGITHGCLCDRSKLREVPRLRSG